MTTKKRASSWDGHLRDAAPIINDDVPKAKPERIAISVQDPDANDFRIIVKSERKPMGEVKQMALRLPTELSARLDTHVAGQRHAAILALIEFGLDELIRQNKVLDIK